MRDTNNKIKAGEVIVLSTGEYSDYGYEAHLAFRQDCDLEQLADKWLRSIQDELPEWDSPTLSAFTAWLVVEGFAVAFDVREIHCGSYDLEIGSVEAGYDKSEWKLLPDASIGDN